MKRISVAEPSLSGNEQKYVLDCLQRNWISSGGDYVLRFEEEFARYCGVNHAITTCSGTTALHLSLVCLDLQPGDEVIVPSVTYVATANAVRYCNAVPVFADVEPNTLNIDPESVQRLVGPRTKGIIPVHLYGHPANITAIDQIAADNGLWVVYDAAEAHGAEYSGKRIGAEGRCAVFSFFGNKIITTGEGGMITTNDGDLASKLRLYRGQGMDPERRYWFPVIGYNYRLTNLQAAVGVAQLERIDTLLRKRQSIVEKYVERLGQHSDVVELPTQSSGVKHAFWMFNVFVKGFDAEQRDKLIAAMDGQGVETRPTFIPIHMLPPHSGGLRCPVGEQWAARGLNLPTHPNMDTDDVARVCDTLLQAIEEVRA